MRVTAAPVFPSLRQEGAEGGFDVSISFAGSLFFLQFKLSDYMKRRSAVEWKKHGLFEPPFYRFYLRAKKYSDQHELLLELESQGNNVYYVAPKFHLTSELNDAYLNREMINRSIFVRPSQIGSIPIDWYHHVAFRDGYPAYLLSEPKKIIETINEELNLLNEIENITLRNSDSILNRETLTEIASGMISIVKRSQTVLPGMDEGQFDRLQAVNPYEQIGYLSRIFFDCELFVVEPVTKES